MEHEESGYARGAIFGEPRERRVLWGGPRAATEGVGVNLLHGVVLSKLLYVFVIS